jgi:XTP/dITP diphosphohydrolase
VRVRGAGATPATAGAPGVGAVPGGPRLQVVVASRNPGKLAELGRLLAGLPWELIDLEGAGIAHEIEEPHDSYDANARAKAMAVAAATGMAALADDSGIEVPALGGWPGPRSARWLPAPATDRDRLEGLLDEVRRRCPEQTRARYACAVCLARPGMPTLRARGETWGHLVAPRGSGGFGYDPAFLSDDLGMTFGEATEAAKDGVSHRARALAALVEALGLRAPASVTSGPGKLGRRAETDAPAGTSPCAR